MARIYALPIRRIFALITLVIGMALPLSIAHATVQCTQNEAGDLEVVSQDDWSNDDIQIFDELEALGNDAALARKAIYVDTNKNPTLNDIQKLKTRLAQAKTKLEKRLTRVLGGGEKEFSLIAPFLRASRNTLLSEMGLQANSVTSLKTIAQNYGLQLSQESYLGVFNSDERFILGTTLVPTEKNQVLLTFSDQNLFQYLARGLGRGLDTKSNDEKMLRTLRCQLTRVHLDKIARHKNLLGVDESATSFQAQSCAQISANEIQSLALGELRTQEEEYLRLKAVDILPSAVGKTDPSMAPIVSNPNLMAFATAMILFPKYRDMQITNQHDDIKLANAFIEQIITSQKDSFSSNKLGSLYESYFSKEFRAELNQSVQSCAIEVDFLDSQIQLEAAEKFLFLQKLNEQIRGTKIHLRNLNQTQVAALIEKIIDAARRDAFYQVIAEAIAYNRKPSSPNQYDLTDRLKKEKDSEFAKIILNSKKYATARKSLAAQMTKIILDTRSAKNYLHEKNWTLIRESLVSYAKEIEKNVSERISFSDLPFVPAAAERTMENEFAALSGITLDYAQLVYSKHFFGQKKSAFAIVTPRLLARAKELGVNCEDPGFIESKKNFVTGLFNENQNKNLAFSNQCQNLLRLFIGTGLYNKVEPVHMRDYEQTMARLFTKDRFEEFQKEYRKQLTNEFLKSAPLLSAKVGRNLGPYVVTITGARQDLWKILASSISDTDKNIFIRQAINESIEILDESLDNIVSARKAEDMGFLFERTSALRAIFGGDQEHFDYLRSLNAISDSMDDLDDLSLESGVLTELREEHNLNQNLYYRTERLQSEIFSDIVQMNVMVGWTVIGGWALKHVLKFTVPRMLGGGVAASALSVAGRRANDVIAAHADGFGFLLLAQIGLAELEKWVYRFDYYGARDFFQTESEIGPRNFNLVNFQEFLKVKRFKDLKVAELTSIQKWNAGFWLMPYAIQKVSNYGSSIQGYFRNLKNFKMEMATLREIESIERKVERQARRQLKLLSLDIRVLGKPSSLSPAVLQARVEEIRLSGGSARQIRRAQEAYERIVFEIGREAQNLTQFPRLLNAYGRAIIGKDATSREILEYVKEFDRIYYSQIKGAI